MKKADEVNTIEIDLSVSECKQRIYVCIYTYLNSSMGVFGHEEGVIQNKHTAKRDVEKLTIELCTRVNSCTSNPYLFRVGKVFNGICHCHSLQRQLCLKTEKTLRFANKDVPFYYSPGKKFSFVDSDIFGAVTSGFRNEVEKMNRFYSDILSSK